MNCKPMSYVSWLFALGALAGAFYVDAQEGSDLAVLGWWLAFVGWGLAGALNFNSRRMIEEWEESIRRMGP